MSVPLLETPLSEQLRDVVDRLARQYQPSKIILFGSLAWGRPDPESDVDLLLIKESQEAPRERRIRVGTLLHRSGGTPFPLDVLVYTPAEIERRLSLGDPFVRRILDEGVVLYDAPGARSGLTQPRLELEPFSPGDRYEEGIARLYCEALGLDWEPERKVILDYFARWPDFRGAVALVDGQVAGVGWGTRTGPGEWLYDRAVAGQGIDPAPFVDAWLLCVLAVGEDYRRRGIATALHDALLQAQPCPRALVSTQVENIAARALYERRGWQDFVPECVIDMGWRRLVVLHREVR